MNIFTSRVSLGDALDRYTEWLATTRRFVPRTKREYTDDVSDLVGWLETRCRLRSPASVQRQHLAGFLAHCVTLRQAPGTRRRSVAAIRSFFAFLVEDGLLRASPAEHLLPPEREDRPPRVLSAAEYTRLRHAAADSPRDLAIIDLILQTDLRLSEVANLRMDDVALSPIDPRVSLPVGHVRVAGRGHRSRTVALNIRACEALSTYLRERDDPGFPALFLTKFGGGHLGGVGAHAAARDHRDDGDLRGRGARADGRRDAESGGMMEKSAVGKMGIHTRRKHIPDAIPHTLPRGERRGDAEERIIETASRNGQGRTLRRFEVCGPFLRACAARCDRVTA